MRPSRAGESCWKKTRTRKGSGGEGKGGEGEEEVKEEGGKTREKKQGIGMQKWKKVFKKGRQTGREVRKARPEAPPLPPSNKAPPRKTCPQADRSSLYSWRNSLCA